MTFLLKLSVALGVPLLVAWGFGTLLHDPTDNMNLNLLMLAALLALECLMFKLVFAPRTTTRR